MTRGRAVLIAGVALVLTAAMGFAGYQRLFSSFAPYDDEGYLMLSLRMYLDGHPLYDSTYTQYGPAFYALNGLLHHAGSLPVTHDLTRFKTLFVWLATAALCGGLIYRFTDSPLLSCVALLATYFHLDRLGLEPGHPQDLCLLGVAGTLLLASWMGRGGGRWRELGISCLLGGLSAMVAMTKINVGGLLFGGVALTLVVASPPGRLRGALLAVLVSGAACLPWALARQHALGFAGVQLPVVVTCSLAAVLVVLQKTDFSGLVSPACVWVFAGSFAAGCLLFAFGAASHGTSWAGLLDGLLLQHLGFVESFYEDPPIYPVAAPAAVLALAAAAVALRAWPSAARLARLAVIVMLVGVSLRHLTDSFTIIEHGANDRGQAALLVSMFTPLLWLLLLPYGEAAARPDPWLARQRFARLFLCSVAIFQPLGVYPVPGTQVALGSLALLLAALICAADILRFPQTLGVDDVRLRRGLAGGLIGLALLTLTCRVGYLWQQRSMLTPMALTGSQRLRLPADFVARKQWTVDQLQRRAETFICLQNGHNSLYFWSRLDPPTAINTTLWQDLLNDRQQRRIVAALAGRQRVCVVLERSEPMPQRRDGPLTRYILENFAPVARNGSTEIWMRADPSLGSPSA